MKKKYTIAMLALAASCAASLAAESLWLPSIFSENMVLQREMTVPVWGRAKPGVTVAVAFYDGGKELAGGEAVADAKTGRWRVDLPALPTGGRYTLLVEAKGKSELETERRMFSNVLVGEVWVLCGQSNMMHPMNACAERDDAIARRQEFPLIRFAQVGHRGTHEITEPQEEVQGCWGPVKWEDASYLVPRSSATDISGSCSAVGYFFARALSETLGRDVPVAVIEVGAILPAETWVDPELAAAVPELAHLLGKGYPNATGRGFMSNIVPLAPYAPQEILDQAPYPFPIARLQPHALVHAEPGVFPRPNVGHHLLRDLALGQQQREDFLLPQLEKRFGGQLGQRHKRPFGQKCAFADQRVNVRVPMDELPEGLDGTDHTGHGVGPAADRPVNRDDRAGRHPAQLAQQPAIEPEVNPQPLGDREHEPPMRYFGADVLGHPASLL